MKVKLLKMLSIAFFAFGLISCSTSDKKTEIEVLCTPEISSNKIDVNKILTESNNLSNLEKEKLEVKKTALAVSYAILERRWDDLDKLLDDKFTYTGDGYVFNKDEYIGFMQDMKTAFSDLKMNFPHILVDGELASIRFISTAVNTGKFMGAPANSKHLEINGTFIRKIKNGKVMQEWQTTDLLGVMHQIGFGALFGYSVFVGLFDVEQKRPVRKYCSAKQ